MTEWVETTMADVMTEFHDGPHATPPPVDEGPIYLGIKNVTEAGSLDLSAIRHISDADFGKWTKRVTPRAGDIVFSYEATLHRYALIPEGFRGCLGRRLALIRPNTEKVEPRFLHLAFLGPQWRATVRSRIISGATVDRIPIITFPEFPITLPPLEYQRTVVGILGAIDDLIENNRRRVAVLEDMARTIYREWFVHFRYPGHADVPLVDSALGPIPSSWEVSTLGAAATWLSGGTPSTKVAEYWNGEIPWITSGSLKSFLLDSSERRLKPAGLEHGSRLVNRDTLIIVVRGMSLATEFRHGIADVPVAFGQDCKALVARPGVEPLFLALSVASRAWRIQHMVEFAAHGTGKLSTDRIQALPLAIPPTSIQKAFVEVVRPVREVMSVLGNKNRVLADLRDLLLPKLVSGQIDVSDLDLDALVTAATDPASGPTVDPATDLASSSSAVDPTFDTAV